MNLPCEECKGKCCTYPTFTVEEFQVVVEKHPISPFARIGQFGNGVVLHMADGACPFVKQGRCSIYEDRPQACKDYGMKPELPCMYLYPAKALTRVHLDAIDLERKLK